MKDKMKLLRYWIAVKNPEKKRIRKEKTVKQ